MASQRTRALATGLLLALTSPTLVSVAQAAEQQERDAPAAAPEPARVNLLVYGLFLHEELWDIPLNYGGAAGGVRVHLKGNLSFEGACEVLLGQTAAGLSSQLVREQIGIDESFGIFHVRPAVNVGLTLIDRVTKDETLVDPFIGASLRAGPELAISRHDALALDLSLDVGSTTTWGFGLGLRYVRF